MIESLFRRFACFFILCMALTLAGCAPSALQTAPAAEAQPSPVPPTQIPFPTPPSIESSPAPAILESRRLTLEFPSQMRAGVEGDVIRLTLEVDNLGNVTPTAKVQGNTISGEVVQIPDLYETHQVVAEAQLDLAGMTVQPAGAIYEPLTRGQSATFYWSVRPSEAGIYRGTVWLHLNFTNKQTGERSRIPVSAQIIEIKAVDFLGFSVNVARMTGVVGSFVGGVLGFPFLEDILKFLFKRKSNKENKNA
jgi:hypothetical protein